MVDRSAVPGAGHDGTALGPALVVRKVVTLLHHDPVLDVAVDVEAVCAVFVNVPPLQLGILPVSFRNWFSRPLYSMVQVLLPPLLLVLLVLEEDLGNSVH